MCLSDNHIYVFAVSFFADLIPSEMGFKITVAGPLPEHLAILVNTTARMKSLIVEAAMKKSKEDVYHAVYMDPLTSAVCSLDEIKSIPYPIVCLMFLN